MTAQAHKALSWALAFGPLQLWRGEDRAVSIREVGGDAGEGCGGGATHSGLPLQPSPKPVPSWGMGETITLMEAGVVIIVM